MRITRIPSCNWVASAKLALVIVSVVGATATSMGNDQNEQNKIDLDSQKLTSELREALKSLSSMDAKIDRREMEKIQAEIRSSLDQSQRELRMAQDEMRRDQIAAGRNQRTQGSVDEKTRGKSINIKPFHLDLPKMKAFSPAIHIHIPAIHVHRDGHDVDISPINIDLPKMDIDTKGIHIDIPAIHVEVPKVDVSKASRH